ncbi:Zn-dependent protease with chaperone function [Xenococcus sp. PCC 7305]|uniref:M48 family metalloprotease n=1 Tax=Xenococcus sp. PCC 7305 TaxID=102125 RepID=UPI0002AC4EB9|nr:M48 family metalloprotease [Xenococcus sp. PCC 7305]ELS02255.1 Zn-dependent protease with chaperone function [Xenococcus sp. PCC 7305]
MSGNNQIKTAALLGLLSGLLVLGGYWATGNAQGAMVGLVMAAMGSFGSWFYSDKAALAAYRAQPINREQAPELYDLVADLATKADLPMPKLCIVPTQTPNAFATGRDPEHAAVAVTQGIVQILNQEELAGVIAHELTHIKNRDTLTQAVAGTLGGAITFLGKMLTFGALYGPVSRDDRRGSNPIGVLLLVVLAPIAASIIQMAISRTREFSADRGAAEITQKPLALANALQKLESIGRQVPMNGNPAFEPVLIINPFSGGGLQSLFRTHPPTQERVQQLQAIAQQQQNV